MALKLIPLLLEEQVGKLGATHVATLTAGPGGDLTESTAGTAQTLSLAIPPGKGVTSILTQVDELFADDSDAAFNTVTVSVGNNADDETFQEAQEVSAKAATPALIAWGTGEKQATTAADTLKVVFTPKTDKKLSDLDRGKLRVYVAII